MDKQTAYEIVRGNKEGHVIDAWQYLIDAGFCSQNNFLGRTAAWLISEGLCSPRK
jgi:hypothetical protein